MTDEQLVDTYEEFLYKNFDKPDSIAVCDLENVKTRILQRMCKGVKTNGNPEH